MVIMTFRGVKSAPAVAEFGGHCWFHWPM